MKFPAGRSIILVSAVLIALLAFGTGYRIALPRKTPTLPEVEGVVWPRWPPLESFSLIDSDGNALGDAQLRGKWTLLFFGYTHCPDVCPTTLVTLRETYAALQAFPPFNAHGQVLFVSVDAQRDTPEQLRTYTAHFNPAFRAATAHISELSVLLRQFDAPVIRVSGRDAKEYWYEHPAAIYLVGPDLRVVGRFSPPHDSAALAERTRLIIAYGEATRRTSAEAP